jgi:hypothetical protein
MTPRLEWRHAYSTTSVRDFAEAAAALLAPPPPAPITRTQRRRALRELRRIR